MKIEYEATFRNIDKKNMRQRLLAAGAKLLKKEFLQRRKVFHLPKGHEIENGWLRVRDEGDKITMSLKVVVNNANIEDQKELELTVSDFDTACMLMERLGNTEKAYQESKRESWCLDDVEITIDEWPFLEPFVEVEGESKEMVEQVSKMLGFEYDQAYFGSVTGLYAEKYGISEAQINNQTPEILFSMSNNPFTDLKR